MKNLLTLIFVFCYSNITTGSDAFNYLGSFDDVRATDTGHCYGKSVSLWKMNNQNIIGLFNVHSGLCGDPPCSIIEGEIKNDEISFKTNVLIFNEKYDFSGTITKQKLSGKLNGSSAQFKLSQFQQTSIDKNQWCSNWLKVLRCNGVKKYCK